MEPKDRRETCRKLAEKMEGLPAADKTKALKKVMWEEGVTPAEAVPRIVKDFWKLGDKATEAQVRERAATASELLGVSVDRFVELWRADCRRR